MSARYSRKANFLAGGFLIVGVVLAVLTSFVLADVRFTPMTEYIVRFSIRDGATGLSPEAAVRVGGQPQGKVESIRVEQDLDTGEYVVNVRVSLRSDIRIYEDAWAYLEVPLLGTASTLNIPYLGSGEGVEDVQGSSPRLEPGEVLWGSVAPPAFLANAGYGPQQREQLQRMIENAELAMRRISEALDAIGPRVEPVAEDVRETVASARRTVTGIEEDAQRWRQSVSATLENAEAASERIAPLVENAEIVVADAGEMIRSGRAVIDDNRPRIDNIIANTDEVMAGVRTEWVPRGTELLETSREGAARFTEIAGDVDQMLTRERPGIERALANLRIASDQLKFLAIEARAQPWRLLHRPDTKELENQLLYDSARSYAVAVSDLRVASEALDSLVETASQTGAVEADALQAMRSRLQQAFERYAEAEADLLDRMIEANE